MNCEARLRWARDELQGVAPAYNQIRAETLEVLSRGGFEYPEVINVTATQLRDPLWTDTLERFAHVCDHQVECYEKGLPLPPPTYYFPVQARYRPDGELTRDPAEIREARRRRPWV